MHSACSPLVDPLAHFCAGDIIFATCCEERKSGWMIINANPAMQMNLLKYIESK